MFKVSPFADLGVEVIFIAFKGIFFKLSGVPSRADAELKFGNKINPAIKANKRTEKVLVVCLSIN